jgi:type II secretory pathway pseudopilin PulG
MDGFTLVEVLFLILLLGMMFVSITGVYFSSSHAFKKDENPLSLESRLRDRMEEIISRSFDDIVDGSDSVAINGKIHTISWTVTYPDLNGDAIPESIAKKVTVNTGNLSLTTLVVHSQDVVGKL